MLIWAAIFLVLTIIFGYFAFKRSSNLPVAKVIFFICLVLFIVLLIFGLMQLFFHPEIKIRAEPPLIPSVTD